MASTLKMESGRFLNCCIFRKGEDSPFNSSSPFSLPESPHRCAYPVQVIGKEKLLNPAEEEPCKGCTDGLWLLSSCTGAASGMLVDPRPSWLTVDAGSTYPANP